MPVGITELMLILAAVPALVGIGGVQGQMGLIAMGGEREKQIFRNVYLIAGVVALISVCVFAYLWGTMGAAVALVLTEFSVCIGMWSANNRKK